MTQAGFLATSFPNSKIIHIVRDGRAVSHSLVSRDLEFPPFSNRDHSQNLKQWAKLATGFSIHNRRRNRKCKTFIVLGWTICVGWWEQISAGQSGKKLVIKEIKRMEFRDLIFTTLYT